MVAALLAQVAAGQDSPPATKPSSRLQKTASTPALPARKAGLWQVTVRSDDLVLRHRGQARQVPQTVQMCTDAAAEPVMLLAIVPGQENCRKVQSKRLGAKAGGGWQIQTVCLVHGNRVEADIRIAGDLQTEYHGSYDVRYPTLPLYNSGRMLFEGRWLGACQPRQRPGDMVLPVGVTVNVVEDRKHAETHED